MNTSLQGGEVNFFEFFKKSTIEHQWVQTMGERYQKNIENVQNSIVHQLIPWGKKMDEQVRSGVSFYEKFKGTQFCGLKHKFGCYGKKI
jgi:hypothetical protein